MLRIAFAMLTTVALAVVAIEPASAQTAKGQTVGGRLKAIVASKTIKIAHRTDAVPFSFFDSAKSVAGYTVDICKAMIAPLQRQLKLSALNVQWVPVTSQSRFDAIVSGKADIECGASTVTLSRMRQVDFSTYVFIESTGPVARSAAGVSSLNDLAGKKIAVIAGTSNEKAMMAKNQDIKATFVSVKDRDATIAAMASGQVDAFASDKLLLAGMQFKDIQNLQMLPDNLSVEPYAIVLPRSDWELRLAVNTALAEIFRTGQVDKIFAGWFGKYDMKPGLLNSATFMLGAIPE
jgi:glutamate/aspartate transport system substrate-binding protein